MRKGRVIRAPGRRVHRANRALIKAQTGPSAGVRNAGVAHPTIGPPVSRGDDPHGGKSRLDPGGGDEACAEGWIPAESRDHPAQLRWPGSSGAGSRMVVKVGSQRLTKPTAKP
jgi:hypothetical protein